jgi:hypothetical protein
MERVGEIFYGAVRRGDVVSAYVAVTETFGDGTVGVKTIHEESGPYFYGASEALLASLTPTSSPRAAGWRADCRLYR